MRTRDINDALRMLETVGDFVTIARAPQQIPLKVQVEPDLILEDISEEEFKKAVRETVIVKQKPYDADEQSVVDECMDMFYNMHHRECPLTVPRNIEGLVSHSAFWHDSQGSRKGLYDFCRPETKEQSLVPVAFPAKQLNVNRFPRVPNNDPAPLSIMAQYLYNQMEEVSKITKEVESVGTNQDGGKRAMVIQNVHKGVATAWNAPEEEQEEPMKKKKTGSRVMRCLRKWFSCIRKNDGE